MRARAAAIAVMWIASCSRSEPERAGPASGSVASPPSVEVWPPVVEKRAPAAPWPAGGGAWAVALIGTNGQAPGLEGRSPLPTRRVYERDGLTYTFGSDVNYTVYFFRVVLPGAAAKHADARAWFGLPEHDPIPSPKADSHLEITFHGDEVEIRSWANHFAKPEVDARGVLLAVAALDDELDVRDPEQHRFHWFDLDDANPRDLTIEIISWDGCGKYGDAWLDAYRRESPTSARRRALKAIGFRRVRCRWVQPFQTYEFP